MKKLFILSVTSFYIFCNTSFANEFQIDSNKYPSSGVYAYFSSKMTSENAQKVDDELNKINNEAGFSVKISRKDIDNCYSGFVVVDSNGVRSTYVPSDEWKKDMARIDPTKFPTYKLLNRRNCTFDNVTFVEKCIVDSSHYYYIYHKDKIITNMTIASDEKEINRLISGGEPRVVGTLLSCLAVKDDILPRASDEKASKDTGREPVDTLADAAVYREYLQNPSFRAEFLKTASSRK